MQITLDAHLARVYGAKSPQELAEAYDLWAESYDRDMLEDLGWGGPEAAATVLAAHAATDAPVLDVGAGTGLAGESLRKHGFAQIFAADLSERMVALARARGVYAAVHHVSPGALPFGDGEFGSVVAVGVLTQGHAGPESLAEWVRITRPGGHIAFTLRPDLHEQLGYRHAAAVLEIEKKWSLLQETEDQPGFRRLQSKPYRVWVYRVN